MSVVATFPGRMGDATLQYPVMYQWSKVTGKTFDCWIDEGTCKPLESLFASQPFVGEVKLVKGVESYQCGGQPFHMSLPNSAFAEHTIYHMGFRAFPQRQITLETLENVKLPVPIDRKALETEPCFVFDPQPTKRNLLLLHGQAICPHTKQTPAFWKFLAGIHRELDEHFDEVLWLGDKSDREIGSRTYPHWSDFDDGGSLLETAKLMGEASCFIGCGSSMAALAQVMKVPAIRVHDPIGEAPRVIWSGLGENQLNETETVLRTEWPLFRDRWLKQEVTA